MMKRKIFFLLTALLCAALLAGCSGSALDIFFPTPSPTATAEPTPSPTAEPTPTPEPTPEPTPVPEYEGLSVQPTTYYNEGEQPTYTVTDGNNLNMRGGPGTDYDKIGQVPASTSVTALGTNEDGSWVVVNYNGTYGWLKTEFLNG